MRRSIKNVSLLAWLWLGLVLIVTLVGLVNDFGGNNLQGGLLKAMVGVFDWLSIIAFPLVGVLIVSRQPKNTIGWLLMVPSLTAPLDLFTRSQISGLVVPPAHPSVIFMMAAYVSNTTWLFAIFPIFFIALFFPTGKPLSPRWRWAVTYAIGVFVVFVSFAVFDKTIAPDTSLYGVDWSIPNPLGFWDTSADETIFSAWLAGVVVLALLCMVSIVLRYRRAAGVERKQINWLLYAVSLFAIYYAIYINFQAWGKNFLGLFLDLFLMAIPLAIGIAILRYRLYDIDLIIRRTLQYTILTGLLALTYFGGVVILQEVLGSVTGEFNSPLVTVITTLGIAALFIPLRTRVQDFIDRRFYRKKYDAEQALAQFSATARDEVDMEKLTDALLGAIAETMQPEKVGLWLRSRTPKT